MDTPHKVLTPGSASVADTIAVSPDHAGPRGQERERTAAEVTTDPGDDEATAAASRPAGANLARGRRFGRYVILSELGRGGMGVVYTAHDSELDRKVAIKVLLGGHTEEQGRMQREAQALARLAHPNVVTVHDVGIVDGWVFVAMEFVAGETLRDFAEKHKDDWRRVVRVYIAAGRGLEAAHKAGLVHRDFKPDNVLVDGDDRPRVLDFGLACATPDPSALTDTESSVSGLSRLSGIQGINLDDLPLEMTRSSLDVRMTQTGATMGTPAYMAPEQAGGLGKADARADQFAFCVSLYEALYGVRPFGGDSVVEILCEIMAGRIQPPARGERIPGALRRVLVTGMAEKPDSRHPSMAPVLAALEASVTKHRATLRWVATGVSVGAAALAGAMISESGAVACEPDATLTERLWGADRRARVEDALLSGGEAYAADTWARVERSVERYVQSLVDEGVANCEATHVQGEQSLQMLDLRTACLDRRHRQLHALLDALAEGSPEARRRAAIATAELPSLEACRDRTALASVIPPPTDAATLTELDRLRAALDRAEALRSLGHYKKGLTLAREAVTGAVATGYAPIEAETLLAAGRLAVQNKQLEEAQELLSRAFTKALAARDARIQAQAAAFLLKPLSSRGADTEESDVRWWWANAEALADYIDDPKLRVMTAEKATRALLALGHYREARDVGERARAWREEVSRDDSFRRATTYLNLSTVYYELADYRRALDLVNDARELYQESLGELHPATIQARNNAGVLLWQLDELEAAALELAEVVRLNERVHGADSQRTADSKTNLGILYLEAGDATRGRETLTWVFEDSRRRSELDQAMSASNLAYFEVIYGDPKRAEELVTRSIATLRAINDSHPRLYVCEQTMGLALLAQGRNDAAALHIKTALQMQERELGTRSSSLAETLIPLAQVQLALGDLDAAEATLARADALEHDDSRVSLRSRAEAALYRARLLEQRGLSPERRATLLRGAREYFDARPRRHAAELALAKQLQARL